MAPDNMNFTFLSAGQFAPAEGGQFESARHGHFKPAHTGQLVRRLQSKHETTKSVSDKHLADENPHTENVSVAIKLKGNRLATLTFPIDFNDDDLKKMYKVIKAYIEAYGDNLDLDEKKNNEAHQN